MRLWVKESERRPSPPPVKTDDRMVWIVGLAAWAIGLVVVAIVTHQWPAVWACVAGLVLGVLGLGYTALRTRRAR